MRRYKRFRRYRRVVIADFFRMYYHSGPNFWSSFRRYIRFVVITDVVINDFYCIVVYSLHPDVVIPTFCGAVKSANEDTFWTIRKLVTTTTRADVKQAILLTLGRCHPDDKVVKK